MFELDFYPKQWEPVSHGPHVYRLASGLGFDRVQPRQTQPSELPPLVDDIEDAIEEFCEDFNLDIAATFEKDGVTYFALQECPFVDRAHRGAVGKTCITLSDTSVGFSCFSDECADHTFQDLRRLLEQRTGYKSDVLFYEHEELELTEEDFGKWGLDRNGEDPNDRIITVKEATALLEGVIA